jgi:hypothetical protein
MVESVDNGLQKVPSKEKTKNTTDKVKSEFFKIGIKIHANQ